MEQIKYLPNALLSSNYRTEMQEISFNWKLYILAQYEYKFWNKGLLCTMVKTIKVYRKYHII